MIKFCHVYDSHSHTKPQPGYDRKMVELLSNRRESVPLIVVVVVIVPIKISRNKVDGHVQNFRAAITSRRQILHGRNTNRVWSYHQSHVVAPPVVCDCVSSSRTISSSTSHKLSRLVVRPISMLPTISICNRSRTIGGTHMRAIANNWIIVLILIHWNPIAEESTTWFKSTLTRIFNAEASIDPQ